MATDPRSENRHYTGQMARTHRKVRFLPKGKPKHTEASAAKGVEEVLRILEGRWKLVILLDALLTWVDLRDSLTEHENTSA
jgi:DNA-binding HxlR family transcriptional regulator